MVLKVQWKSCRLLIVNNSQFIPSSIKYEIIKITLRQNVLNFSEKITVENGQSINYHLYRIIIINLTIIYKIIYI